MELEADGVGGERAAAGNWTAAFSSPPAIGMVPRGAEGLQTPPLEGDGFELPVSREIAEACRRHEQTVAILRPGDHRKVMDHLWAPTSGPDLWPLTARTVFQPLKPSSPPQPFRAVWRGGPPNVNARKTNAVGGPAAAVSTRRRIEPQAAATGRCMSRPAPRAASDWRAA